MLVLSAQSNYGIQNASEALEQKLNTFFIQISDPSPSSSVVSFGYVCRWCFQVFNSVTNVTKHVDSNHNGPSKCLKCNQIFEDRKLLVNHKKCCKIVCPVPGCVSKHSNKSASDKHLERFNSKNS